MRYWAFGLVASLASLAGPWLFAEDLRLELQGGPQLTVKAVADQQQWITHGDKIWVAAVRGGKLVVKEISLGSPPEPWPGPEPGPRPEPQPGPGPKTVIWIEESGQRTPQQAAAIIDKNVRAAIDAARWTLRVTDVDVVDESGRPPADLAPYLERARHAGLPWMVILEDGREVYTGKAPPDLPSLVILLRRFGLPVGAVGDSTEVHNGPAAQGGADRETISDEPAERKPDTEPERTIQAAPCPTGQCPVPRIETRRWRLFR